MARDAQTLLFFILLIIYLFKFKYVQFHILARDAPNALFFQSFKYSSF